MPVEEVSLSDVIYPVSQSGCWDVLHNHVIVSCVYSRRSVSINIVVVMELCATLVLAALVILCRIADLFC